MKLTDLNSSPLLEGRVDPNVLLSIDNLIATQGTKSNTFQLLMVARIVAGLKGGYFYKDTNYWESLYSVSSEMMNMLRAMPPEELFSLAVSIRDVLEIKDKDTLYTYANPEQETLSYMKWLLSRKRAD